MANGFMIVKRQLSLRKDSVFCPF